MRNKEPNTEPNGEARKTWKQYEQVKTYLAKPEWGNMSLYDRVEKNNDFYEGNQWEDFKSDVSLPIFNICKQIGQAQMAIICSNVLTASYSWEGISSLDDTDAQLVESEEPSEDRYTAPMLAQYFKEEPAMEISNAGKREPSNQEMRAVSALMSKYFRTVSERLYMDTMTKDMVADGFKNGCGVVYFYWNDKLKTGQTERGDVEAELLEIIQVLFGDPTTTDVQKQPYIILETRRELKDVQKEAEGNKVAKDLIENIKPDRETPKAEHELEKKDGKVTVLIKFWKEYKDNGDCTVYVQKSTRDVVVKEKTDIKIDLYPVALMPYENKRNSIYANTPLTEILSNQRVVNLLRYNQVVQDSYTAQPILLYDTDRIDEISNEIGAKIPVNGNINDVARYLQGTGMAASSENLAQVFMRDTLDTNNVNDAVRGNLNPDNTSAIIALRDAAKMPMQMYAANLYKAFEDMARIIGAYMLSYYGNRRLKIEENGQVFYVPFHAERYKDYLLSVRVDVGESTLWSETATIRTLDNLLMNHFITPRQYLERIPDGYVPMKQELINELAKQEEEAKAMQEQQMLAQQSQQQPLAEEAPPEQAGGPNWDQVLQSLSDEEIEMLQRDPTAQRELSEVLQGQ